MEINSSKPLWKYVKSRKQDNIGVKEKGHSINDSKEKALILIKQFSSVFTREKVENMPETHLKIKQSLPKLNITVEGVRKLLRNINTSKASGPDNIPNRVLKQCADQLAPVLTIIFQRSIDHCKLRKEINMQPKTTDQFVNFSALQASRAYMWPYAETPRETPSTHYTKPWIQVGIFL